MSKIDYSFRYESAKAEKVLARLIPTSAVRKALGRLIAEIVDAAGSVAPNSWVLRVDKADFFLNVGQVAVLTVNKHRISMVTTQFSRRPSGLTEYHSVRNESVYDAVSTPSALLELSHAQVVGLSADIRKNMRAFARAAAADKTRSPWKKSHSPAALAVLAAAAETDIEQPPYWDQALEHAIALETPGDLARDLDAMRAVERAAVAFVSSRYRRAGWSVVSTESEKVGYDLACRRGGEIRHLEVKGRSAAGDSVSLTNGEWKRAKEDARWFLAVVSFAATAKRAMREYSGRQVRALVGVEPIAFRLSLVTNKRATTSRTA